MQAVRVHPSPSDPPYSATNPAPSTALEIDTIPIPTPTPGHLLIRIKATTIIRDMLTWPETYSHPYTIPGHDFSGIVAGLPQDSDSAFKIGDEVFGMAHADRGSTWAEYAIVKVGEVARKPGIGFEAAAALPLSAQTAYEALFVHGGLALLAGLGVGSCCKEEDEGEEGEKNEKSEKRVLITGASGGVGVCLVQLAALAGVHVVAASGSNLRNGEFLKGLGADQVVEYGAIEGEFDLVVDCVGGGVLVTCWGFVKDGGRLISVDSASYDFVQEHRKRGISKEGVKALFFIVEGNADVLNVLADLMDRGRLKSFVASRFPIERVREAYDYANGRFEGRGKIVLTI